MRSPKSVLLISFIVLFVQACCCTSDHTHVCQAHPEPPFTFDDGPPGTGLVFGTADFAATGSVLIKIQVEDLATYDGDEANITAWSGNGSAPTGTTTPIASTSRSIWGAPSPSVKDWQGRYFQRK